MKTVVFVYGTLKRGGENHEFLREAEYLGSARTKQPYALYMGRYPYAIKDEPRHPIFGEVYGITSPILLQLDELEGHPHLYYREQTTVIMTSDNTEQEAWIYFYPQKNGQLLDSGEFDARFRMRQP